MLSIECNINFKFSSFIVSADAKQGERPASDQCLVPSSPPPLFPSASRRYSVPRSPEKNCIARVDSMIRYDFSIIIMILPLWYYGINVDPIALRFRRHTAFSG